MATAALVDAWCATSVALSRLFPHEARASALRATLRDLSAQLEARPAYEAVAYPMQAPGPLARIVRLLPDEATVLNSAEKAPLLLLVETVAMDDRSAVPILKQRQGRAPPARIALALRVTSANVVQVQLHVLHTAMHETGSAHATITTAAAAAPRSSSGGWRSHHAAVAPSPRQVAPGTVSAGVADMSARWDDRVIAARRRSPFGECPTWQLRPLIVKCGDDCRQEQLAMQLIGACCDIFAEAGLPLWLRPFEVLATSSHSALIEVITDAPSLHTLKARLLQPKGWSLREWYAQHFGAGCADSELCRAAQRNFVESMAAYSLVCYLLALKDRHNGNLLVSTATGHLIHVDFHFMLSHSPGGISFEAAPFKLSREMLEVMDTDAEGMPSDAFNYFKVLCIQGFLALRKHADRIIHLVDMAAHSPGGAAFPCFRGGAPRALQQLRRRFHLAATEEQCVEAVLTLVGDSLDAWSTRQYDNYQRLANGII
jgi:phosphatidylinositol 4-kinase